MHIAEGILPAEWAVAWAVPALAGAAIGLRRVRARTTKDPAFKSLVALMGAAVFAVSLMPIPVPVAGSVSHPAGTPLAAIVVGPMASILLAGISLLVQALFFAHGGLTTLGANLVSEGIVGSFVGFLMFRFSRRVGLSLFWAGFLAGVFGDLGVYLTTAAELGLGLFPWEDASRGAGALFLAFLPTQAPLALLEGLFTGGVLTSLAELRPDIATGLGLGAPSSANQGAKLTGRSGWARRWWTTGGRTVRIALTGAGVFVIALLVFGLVWGVAVTTGEWVGIDEGVMERVAAEQGRSAWTPFINTDVGDLLLYVFFAGAVVAGGAIGWIVRGLKHGASGSGTSGVICVSGAPRRRPTGAATRRAWPWGALALLLSGLAAWVWLAPGLAIGPLDGEALRNLGRVLAHPSQQKVLSARGGDVVLFAFMVSGLVAGIAAGWWARRRPPVRRPRLRLLHLFHSHDVAARDRHAWQVGGLARVDARLKLAVVGVVLGANLVAGAAFSLGLLLVCVAVSLAVVRVRWITLAVRMAPALMVSAMLVVLKSLTVPGGALFAVKLPLVHRFAFTVEGTVVGAQLAVVVLAGVSLLLVLGSSTPLPALLNALRWYRVPGLLIDVGMLMYRYLFLFVEETQRMRQAQRLRGPNVSWRRAMGGFSRLGAHVLIRSYDRSERVYDAQRLRGGEGRS